MICHFFYIRHIIKILKTLLQSAALSFLTKIILGAPESSRTYKACGIHGGTGDALHPYRLPEGTPAG